MSSAPGEPPTVALDGVVVRYPTGTIALDGARFTLERGSIRGLVGENGAGKSTLLGALCGFVPVVAGTLAIGGMSEPAFATRSWTPRRAIARGLGMVHQHFSLVDALSVCDNVALGRAPRWCGAFYDRRRARDEVRELSTRYGLAVDPDAPVHALSLGERQRVEILKALAKGATALVLDEPTAVLAPPEVRSLFAVLRELARGGCAIAITTHKLGEVAELCDAVTVLRAGRVAGELPMARATPAEIARLMMGKDPEPVPPRAPARRGQRALQVAGLAVDGDQGEHAVRDCSLELFAGEILGIAGVLGNGQRELVEALAGLRPTRAGAITLPPGGTIAFVHEDRARHGLVGAMSVAENLVLGRHHESTFSGRWGVLRRGAIHREAVRLVALHDVRPPDPEAPAATLSGGNQQKLVLARELARGTSALVAAQPTRGVDLGATRAIRDELVRARDRGVAILLVSAELDFVLELADRVCVLYRGRVVLEQTADALDRDAIGRAMAGVA